MKNVEAFVRPDTIEEILNQMQRPGALALAGGTTVTLSKDPNVKVLVDLAGAAALRHIEQDGDDLVVGPMVTMTDIIESDLPLPALTQAARGVSSTPIRNQVTVGGEVARGVYWTDLPVALLALDATVKICSASRTRLMSMQELYEKHPTKALAPDELITKVMIPLSQTKSAFLKFAKTNVDYAMLSAAASLTLDNEGNIAAARVAMGAVNALATRLPKVEAHLKGKKPSQDLFKAAADLAVEEVQPRSDFRASKEYQRDLVHVHTLRILENALNA